MLKEIIIAFQSYLQAHQLISRHKLWKWIFIPGFLYMLLFLGGMYFFVVSSGNAVSYLSDRLGIDQWIHQQGSGLLSFFFLMGGIMLRLILLFFYFSLFKYLFLIIGSPLFAYLSEKTAAILENRDFPFSFSQLVKDIFRGIRLTFRNALWQTVYLITILILSVIPLIGWITPLLILFIECYYFGFSMLDYSCERNRLSYSASIRFISKHKGLAIGNGIVFYGMHLIPILGWILAPCYAVVSATLSLYRYQTQPGQPAKE